MKLNTSYVIAGSLLVVGGIWFFVNNIGEDAPLPISTPATVKAAARRAMPTVQVRSVSAVEHPNVLELYGQTQANREVSVKAETSGLVAQVLVREGDRVKKGQTLCRQDLNARGAQVDQAKASLRTIESDLNAARVLAEKGFQSSSRVTAFEAQLDGARAVLKQAEIEADNINIRAPFDGAWERQNAQVGDFLSPGMSCGLLVDLSPLKVNAQMDQTQISKVTLGDSAQIELATGQSVSGAIKFIEAKADPATRTFRVELHVPNASYTLKAGVTTTVRITSGLTSAQQIPGNILTLADNGDVGVRYVDAGNIVRFASVKTIDEDNNGLWVTGLPDRSRVIVEGQDFVSVGMEVDAEENYISPNGSDTSNGQQ
jgi:multidrug efflux system membrane fusion protein